MNPLSPPPPPPLKKVLKLFSLLMIHEQDGELIDENNISKVK